MDKDKAKEVIIEMVKQIDDETDLQMLLGFVRSCIEMKDDGELTPPSF